VAKGYFQALVDLFKEKDIQCPLPTLLNLILFKVGDKGSLIRRYAFQLLQLISATHAHTPTIDSEDDSSDNEEDEEWLPTDMPLPLESSLHDTYLRSQVCFFW
jgi:hypothetical protein